MRSRLVLAGVLAALATVAALVMPSAHAAAYSPTSYGERLVELMNQARAENGVGPLTVASGTSQVALSWTEHLVAVQTLEHNQHLQRDLEAHGSPAVQSYGENVGYASSADADQLFDAYMNSPEHRDNILCPYFHFVGVGVIFDGDRAWNTLDFADTYGHVARTTRKAPAPTHSAAPHPTATHVAAPRPTVVRPAAAASHAAVARVRARVVHHRVKPRPATVHLGVAPAPVPVVTAPPVVNADAGGASLRALAAPAPVGGTVPSQLVIALAAGLAGFVAVRWVAAVR